MKRWGFSAQKPARRAYEQNPVAVSHWLNSTYPIIAERAKEENAEINWSDETGVEADNYVGRGFAPKSCTPVVRLTGNSHRTRIKRLAMDENREKIELFFLPSYSPELNPDERLNGDLKCQVQSGLIARTKEQVKTKVHSAMKSIQRLPERVKKYFRDPISAYASAR